MHQMGKSRSLEHAGKLGAKTGQECRDCGSLVGGLGEIVRETSAREADSDFGVDLHCSPDCGDEGT